VWGGINFLNNHWVLVFKIPSESQNCQFWVFFGDKIKIRIKELLGVVISKTSKKNWWLDRHS
jgi:hypothetical protein